MLENTSNIFKQIPQELQEELFEILVSNDTMKIERIVSYGHVTDEGKWYNQDYNEWVILLKGNARLSFENEDDIDLSIGDFLNIPAHKKHRVSWTEPGVQTIWLAIHY